MSNLRIQEDGESSLDDAGRRVDYAQDSVHRRLNERALEIQREEDLHGQALRNRVLREVGDGDMNRGRRRVERVIAKLSVSLYDVDAYLDEIFLN